MAISKVRRRRPSDRGGQLQLLLKHRIPFLVATGVILLVAFALAAVLREKSDFIDEVYLTLKPVDEDAPAEEPEKFENAFIPLLIAIDRSASMAGYLPKVEGTQDFFSGSHGRLIDFAEATNRHAQYVPELWTFAEAPCPPCHEHQPSFEIAPCRVPSQLSRTNCPGTDLKFGHPLRRSDFTGTSTQLEAVVVEMTRHLGKRPGALGILVSDLVGTGDRLGATHAAVLREWLRSFERTQGVAEVGLLGVRLPYAGYRDASGAWAYYSETTRRTVRLPEAIERPLYFLFFGIRNEDGSSQVERIVREMDARLKGGFEVPEANIRWEMLVQRPKWPEIELSCQSMKDATLKIAERSGRLECLGRGGTAVRLTCEGLPAIRQLEVNRSSEDIKEYRLRPDPASLPKWFDWTEKSVAVDFTCQDSRTSWPEALTIEVALESADTPEFWEEWAEYADSAPANLRGTLALREFVQSVREEAESVKFQVELHRNTPE